MASYRANFFSKRPSADTEGTLRAKIEQKSVASTGGCITWTGARCRDGYGRMKVKTAEGDERVVSPHRLNNKYARQTPVQQITLRQHNPSVVRGECREPAEKEELFL
ncbi:hypothetical protein Bbelb_155850 [Branchiostoma belcheri]|nr:hypothetical protein Bbelb_155850 [Branchiostoma belcheri]